MSLPAAADAGGGGDRRPEGGLRSARDGFPLTRPPEHAVVPGSPLHPVPAHRYPEETSFLDAVGKPWAVRVRGRGLSGTPPDRGAPLLLLQFRRDGDDTQDSGKGEMVERLVVARGLEELSEEQLQGFLADALPPAS